ncbi:unnamed protein product [Phytomonas sp. EM1]|nr:unnamed protein product [Phytomonas sp. EM1]|eukprot:CCW61586.1 unnamed protein product [Phytomonas sp. isolate EM1]
MEYVDCVRRGTNDIDNAVAHLDETRVQLLLLKFLLGGGTFKRTKFLYVIYTGPRCNIVKRGRCVEKIGKFVSEHLKGVAGLSATDKASLSFESLVSQFKKMFIVDDGEFSMAKIRQEHLNRMEEDKAKMHQEKEYERKIARLRAIQARRARRRKKPETILGKCIDQNDDESGNKTKNIMTAIREENNTVNWVVFSPDPVRLQAVSHGCGGIFELVKNLPDDKWLFGLFNITFSNPEGRVRRLIFFQWIGNRAKIVRDRRTSAVYPAMSKLLSPYSYEIYLVGKTDLVPAAIISKCKNAFIDQKSEPKNKRNKPTNSVLDEKNYTETLIEDQEHVLFDCKEFQPEEKQADMGLVPMDCPEMSTTTLSDSFDSCTELYDTEETLRFLMSPEGGLVWAIFEVA